MNINNPTTFGTPNLTLSTSNSSGTGGALRADDTVLVYDTTLPDAITYGQSGSVGSAATAGRRDHAHAMASSTALVTSVTTFTRSGASASGDVSYTGSGFTPSGVIIIAMNDTGDDALGIGFIDSAATDEANAVVRAMGGTPFMVIEPTQVVTMYDAGGSNGQIAIGKTLDSDGVTLTWTKVGTGQSVMGVIYYLG